MQAAAAQQSEALGHLKVLVVAENFEGWERGADWGDLSFFLNYGDSIEKAAWPKHRHHLH